MKGTYIDLEDQNNKYGSVVLDIERYIFYIFLNEEYTPTPEKMEILLSDDQNKFITPHVIFNNFKLENRNGDIVREGVALQLQGDTEPLSGRFLPDDNFDENGILDWEEYVLDALRLTEAESDYNHEKVIVLIHECECAFEKNYGTLDNKIEFYVAYRKYHNDEEQETKYSYYTYKDFVDPEKEYNPFDLEISKDPEGINTHIIPYTKETWDKLVQLSNKSCDEIDKIKKMVAE